MKMKNVLMILITLAVVFAMAGAVSGGYTGFAEGRNTMTVNYTVQNNYTVTIPPDVTIGNDFSSEHFVNATDVLINPDKMLVVNLTSAHNIGGNYYLVCGDNSWIRYYINVTTYDDDANGNAVAAGIDSPVSNGVYFLNVLSGDKYPGINAIGSAGVGGFVKLTFKTTQEFINNATKSGNHIDALTFWLDVVDQ